VPASQFVLDEALHDVLSDVDATTTILMGHTRWKTRGDQRNNANNHPIRAGNVIGTHNGHIANADYLFSRLKLPRFAEVDSEVIFRIADSTLENGVLQIVPLIRRLSRCRGQMSTIMVSRLDPEAAVVVKGDKPLEFRYHRKYRAILYASESSFLDVALAGERGWKDIPIPPMSLLVFHCLFLRDYLEEPLEFRSDSAWNICGGAR
jgi:glucosamine 6-phosphate synthetase-like amidotransferase/phosphosugar isomerase protein